MDEKRTKEPEIQHETLRLLANKQIWTNAEIKHRLRRTLTLSPADRVRANKRPNEEKWEELVNNALSPSRSNSLTKKEFVETVSRGHHRITTKGHAKLIELDTLDEAFAKAIATPEGDDLLRVAKNWHSES